jgi:hypothetical protein
MPKRIDPTELDKIAVLLATHKTGLAVAEIEQAAKGEGLDFDRRTLQRRLRELVKGNRVLKQGKGRASRYLFVPSTCDVRVVIPPPKFIAQAENYVPLTRLGAEIKNLVRRPITERKPVGYNRKFLENYEPNRSAYLAKSVRGHLYAVGLSPARHHAAGTYARDILNRLMIDLSWSSSRLEGNTYSRLDTQNLIEFGHAADGKDQREAQMILNHKAAIEMLVGHAEEIGFDPFTFFNLHALLSENLLTDPAA